ncbi:MAG: translation elongation factor Ts [Akkermansiaceae bacterium]|mgnify:FL=1|jgi:elongation factor Ts|nr:translation elongation factor Ts [Akkermansiaceae bacterium]MDG1853185.1 translation elongation factor Ts [Verrucomicrobiales bacterium]
MAEITASLVKELRDKTNAGMMECKNALKETGGDVDAAIKFLRERGAIKAAKKADREAKEGIVSAKIDAESRSGVLVEVNCETDFVAKNDNFKAFVNELTDAVAGSDASDIESANSISKDEGSLDDFVKAKVIELGENLQFRRMVRYDVEGSGVVASYIHLGGKVGVLLEVNCGKDDTASNDSFRELVKDLTLHIAAASPAGIGRDEISSDLVETEKDLFRKQMEDSGKPPEIMEKIIEGKLGKFYSTVCLLEQGFIKDPDQTISDLLAAKGKDLDDELTVRRFTRFGVGEV